MNFLTHFIEDKMRDAVTIHSMSKTRILMDSGVSPGQYFNSVAGRKPWPVTMLVALGDCGLLGVSTNELLALKAIEEYPAAAIVQAHMTLVEKGLVEPMPDKQTMEGQATHLPIAGTETKEVMKGSS